MAAASGDPPTAVASGLPDGVTSSLFSFALAIIAFAIIAMIIASIRAVSDPRDTDAPKQVSMN